MPVIRLQTRILAPMAIVFDLSRSIDLHVESATGTGERAIGGRTTGLIEMGESVTWEARHFGLKLQLTSKVTAFDRPHHFRDSLVAGPFKRFDHDHVFEEDGAFTLVTDIFDYDAPLGLLGSLANWLFLKKHMERFLEERNAVLRKIAESDERLQFLPGFKAAPG